jgi:Raf kinase inhibitor-like YbhB/YbcL family protein
MIETIGRKTAMEICLAAIAEKMMNGFTKVATTVECPAARARLCRRGEWRRCMALSVTSSSFKDGDYLPKDFILSADFGFGCAGGNKSPHLKWSGAPAGTKSFAVTCYDPDAPTGSGFWHWLVVNIPANVSELEIGAGSAGGKLPAGALQTRTDFGAPGYGGPCPPEGDHPHRYLFTVFAVKADKLDVKPDTSAAVVGFNLHFNTLAKAAIMGLFKR